MKPFLCAAVIFMGTAAFQDNFKPDHSGIVLHETYKGTLPDKYKEFLAAMKEDREKAVQQIYDTLGYTEPIRVNIYFEDYFAPMKGLGAATEGYGDGVKITVAVKRLVEIGWTIADVKQTFAHELIHAYLRNHHVKESYKKIPDWIQEGIAVYGSNQIPYRARMFLKDKGKTLAQIVNGLESSKHSTADYVEDALAFEYIKEKTGADKVKAMAAGLKEGKKEYKTLIKEASGEDFTTFQNNAKKFSLEYLKNLKLE